MFGDRASSRCRVVKLSEQGAAIELPSKRFVNSTFKLMLEKDRTVYSCRLIWSNDNRLEGSFE